MVERNRLKAPLTASITKTERSVGDKMDEIMEQLERNGGKCNFYAFFERGNTAELVVTFLSLLELMKRNDINVAQSDNFSSLTVTFCRERESN